MQKKKPRSCTQLVNLPTELVDDILLKLPVKPLLRFRCVSKRCLALIDSLYFINLHLNRSIETRNNRSLIVRSSYPVNTFSVNVDSTDFALEIDHPLKNSHGKIPVVMGSCNGLVLLGYVGGSGYHYEHIVIWNPFTRKYGEIPIVGFNPIDINQNISYSIGYDSIHDDYKVVKMKSLYCDSNTEVNFYSLKSNTWRKVHDFPYYLCHIWCHGVSSGGALHWVARENYRSASRCIAAFDLATEEHRLVPMPNTVDKIRAMDVAVLEGCLCISIDNWERNCIDVWVMRSYGVPESWTKLVLVGVPSSNITPLVFSKNGREVLVAQSGTSLIWYDLESNAQKMVDVRDLPSSFQVELVTQSLVPIGSGSGTYA